MTQLGPLTTVLVVAGAGSTAICADLGARTIREEIDAMQCDGQQPNPCIYTPAGPAAIYLPSTGEVVGPDGTRYMLENSIHTGDDGWKDMLAPTAR